MPRIPSTIAVAANLADDMISQRINPHNDFKPYDKLVDPNPYVKLKQDIDERLTRMRVQEGDENPESLRSTLEGMSASLERGLNAAFKLAQMGNTYVNYGEYITAQKELITTAKELKEFKQNFAWLQEKYPEELTQEYMLDFVHQLEVDKAAKADDRHFEPINAEEDPENEAEVKDPEPKVSVLKYCGETKSAYEWIEASKQKLHSTDFVDELDAGIYIARIVAARQLANAERKNTDNLKNCTLSEGELDARV